MRIEVIVLQLISRCAYKCVESFSFQNNNNDVCGLAPGKTDAAKEALRNKLIEYMDRAEAIKALIQTQKTSESARIFIDICCNVTVFRHDYSYEI